MRCFLRKLVKLDVEKGLHSIIWNEYPSSIRVLLNNKYVFQPYWEYQKGMIPKERWEEKFRDRKKRTNRSLQRSDTLQILADILEPLWTLRNQLIHGGATWDGDLNRPQVKDGANILGLLVPLITHLMMNNYREPWGELLYPVLGR